MPLTYSWPGPNALTTTTDARKALAGLIETDAAGNVRTGIFPSNTAPIISARADMNVDIAIFQGATVQFGGPVLIANDGVAQLPSALVSPGAGTNYYVVYAKQNESTAPGTDANNNRIFGAQLSTTSFAVARAAMPAGALELGTVEMPTGKTGTNNVGVIITPTFRFTAAEGGTVYMRNAVERDAWVPAAGARIWRIDTQWFEHYDGTGWRVAPGTVLASAVSVTSNGVSTTASALAETPDLPIGQKVKIRASFALSGVAAGTALAALRWLNTGATVTSATGSSKLSRTQAPAGSVVISAPPLEVLFTTTVAAKISAALFPSTNTTLFGSDEIIVEIVAA